MINIDKQIAEVKREIGMRKHVYPRFIQQGNLAADVAAERIETLQAVLSTLETVRNDAQAKKEPGLF